MDIEKDRTRILLATLPHVPFDGWSKAALEAGIRDAGVSADAAVTAFPGGVGELVTFFSDYTDQRMIDVLASSNLADMRVRDRIAEAVRVRLDLLAGHREALRHVLSFLALPQNAPLGLKCLYRTVDAMWRAAGDTATDYNFYTKRMLLSGVYGSTLLYWLDDESADYEDSWAFLDRRIADVMTIEKTKGRLKGFFDKLPDPGELLRRCAPRPPV
ncbi:MAG: COQ9 family protein [Rhodospirillaceae bacterium]|jgi:ubiquinone biosynthesis protein COQ9|nr:COQ9 family protein [Rhodospirillaceae bacterium]MBT5374488.1 COQ9 family protein [Rhodospirillaceae bacterium]MBT5659400.1 COQ9 family protein [Rhodospirillaceae bacterium]MBT5752112.1 COQ9 family protein [Rhodospirillaceae bacterium]